MALALALGAHAAWAPTEPILFVGGNLTLGPGGKRTNLAQLSLANPSAVLRGAPRGASVLLPQRARSDSTPGSDHGSDPGDEAVPVLSVLRQCTSPGKSNNDGFKAVARQQSASQNLGVESG